MIFTFLFVYWKQPGKDKGGSERFYSEGVSDDKAFILNNIYSSVKVRDWYYTEAVVELMNKQILASIDNGLTTALVNRGEGHIDVDNIGSVYFTLEHINIDEYAKLTDKTTTNDGSHEVANTPETIADRFT